MKTLEQEQILRQLPPFDERTEEDWKIYNVVSCVQMIESILCYAPREMWEYEIESPYLDDYKRKLGPKLVENLFKEQLEDLKDATIHEDAFDDGECTYNSIEYKY